jgi:NAD(P)-dependent dehydrogenase (short-subunit alcohol dehydrogenase family)
MPGKIALITGSSGGFGLLTSVELAKAGFRVIATMRDLSRRESVPSTKYLAKAIATGHYQRRRRMPVENRVDNDEQQIVKLFEDGDRALVAVDVAELSRIFADDYVQYDEGGRLFTRQDVLDDLTSGEIRYISMTSTGRRVRLLSKDVAIVHGSEEDVVEKANGRSLVRYVYMDAVTKRSGKWQIVASQLARQVDVS